MSRTKLELILLGVLLQRPQTGYDLTGFMDKAGRFMRDNTSMTQVYRSLRQMEQDGWLTHTVEPRPGAQDAKRYAVTDEGRDTFIHWLSEPYRPSEQPGGGAFFTLLRFRAAYAGVDSVLDLLDTEIAYRKTQIATNRYRDRTEWVDTGVSFDDELAGAVMDWIHHRGADRMDRHLESCVELRAALAQGELPLDSCPNPLLRTGEYRGPDTTPAMERSAR